MLHYGSVGHLDVCFNLGECYTSSSQEWLLDLHRALSFHTFSGWISTDSTFIERSENNSMKLVKNPRSESSVRAPLLSESEMKKTYDARSFSVPVNHGE